MAASQIPERPKGKAFFKWLGPGFLWMVSAAGSGELLFTPRIGSLYGYSLLWALILAVILKWFINREIGRYTVCTGATILDGFKRMGGGRKPVLYLILIPQLFVAVTTIAGLAGSGATAATLAFSGDVRIWAVGSILAATTLILGGKYKGVELGASIIAVLLALSSVVAAIIIFSDTGPFLNGMVPKLPQEVDYGEVLPWLGFMLSGAAGMIWYSHWVKEKGYGRAGLDIDVTQEKKIDYTEEDKRRLRGWIRHMTIDNDIAVGGTLMITIAFLILGAEVLRPEGLVPEENRVAEVLGRLLGSLWGPVGFWFMVLAVFTGFWSTILSDQDGFGRMFAVGFRILLRRSGLPASAKNEKRLFYFFILIILTALPLALYLLMGDPVDLLKIAGAVEAAHIPVLAALILMLNHRELPGELRPSAGVSIMTGLAGLFFALFAVIYMLQVAGWVEL